MPFNARGVEALFECRQCGDCCKGYGGTYVTQEDIEAISRYIGVDPRRFVRQYCHYSGRKPLLAQREDGYCIFWEKICLIHPVKPQMCRQWPFVESILADPSNWLIMSNSCPGINADVSVSVLKDIVRGQLAKDR
jgi:Fe-S-cluster containining protein